MLFLVKPCITARLDIFMCTLKIYKMDPRDKKEEERPFAYPKPTENDQQLRNQPEYIDQEPNSFNNEISDVPGPENTEQESNDMSQGR
jgi:hypothetical protein